MLMVTAPAMAANSPASSSACTMAGEAPAASTTLAAMFMATKLVMHCTSGTVCRMVVSCAPGEVVKVILPLSSGGDAGAGAGWDRASPSDSLRQHYLVQVRRVLLSPSRNERPCLSSRH